jgi:cyclic pyranopterin phosphate synthase
MGITTNGVRLQKFLPQLREANLRTINLSLDTLVPAKFPMLARRPKAWHQRVLETLDAVAAQEEHFTLKVNCVLMRGINDDEIGEFVDLIEHRPIEVRFLEFMPFVNNGWSNNRLVSQADILAAVQKHLASRGVGDAYRLAPDTIHDVARFWGVPGWRGRLGIIASMTNAFCGGCNRIRITADGELRNCLFGEEGWNLRDGMRDGASDVALADVIRTAVRAKYAQLGGKRDMHELRARDSKNLAMVALGG